MRTLANILSWLFLPLFMPIYGLLLVMFIPSFQGNIINLDSLFTLPIEFKVTILIFFVIYSVILPGVSFLMFHWMNIVSTIDMENRLERKLPMLIMFIFCALLFTSFMFKDQHGILPFYVKALPLSGAIVTGSFGMINQKIKISLHAGGAGILTGFLFAYALAQMVFPFWILIAAVLASGLTIFARLYLNKHTDLEVYTGFSLAFAITFVVNYFYPLLN